MKKKLIFGLFIILALAGAGWYFFMRDEPIPIVAQTEEIPESGILTKDGMVIVVDACRVFTQSEADALLGGESARSSTVSHNSETDDVRETNCTYSLTDRTIGVGVDNNLVASVQVRSAKSSNGVENIKNDFLAAKNEAEVVTGYGDSAFWTAEFGQLHVLKGSVWLTFTNGPLAASERTLKDAGSVASLLLPKL